MYIGIVVERGYGLYFILNELWLTIFIAHVCPNVCDTSKVFVTVAIFIVLVIVRCIFLLHLIARDKLTL